MKPSAGTLYRQFNERIRAFVRSRVSDDAQTADLVQDIFLKVHQNIDSLQNEEQIHAWVFRIARNTVIDYYRTRKSHQRLEEFSIPAADTAPDMREVLSEDIREMISRLPPKYRDVLEITELKRFKYSEAARQLNLTVSAVKSRVLRGREMMKEMLLECCHIELDAQGRVMDFTPRTYCPRCVMHGMSD